MRIFVCVKQVPDTETRIKILADQLGIDPQGVKWVINPYDEFAIEEAVKYKEAHPEAQVTAITVGPKARVNNALLTAMAMGVDDSILVDTDVALDSLTTAKALAQAIQKEGDFSLIFAGKLAIDGNLSAVPLMLAELLGVPHSSVVNQLEYAGQNLKATREVEGGNKETFELQLPALITASKGLNKPRFASLPGIMKAKKKPVKNITLDELGLNESNIKIKFTHYEPPAEKPPCKMIEGDPKAQVDELVRLLQEEAKVL